jgi:hypothetical protein
MSAMGIINNRHAALSRCRIGVVDRGAGDLSLEPIVEVLRPRLDPDGTMVHSSINLENLISEPCISPSLDPMPIALAPPEALMLVREDIKSRETV